MIKSEADIHIPKNVQDREPFLITNLLDLCEDQNSLLKEEDKQIGQLIMQLSEYEQELYEKDLYIRKLEDDLGQGLKTSNSKEDLL
ncbi:MAG: hypothetical protein GEU26_16280 [Nitrososphaeraceae archaeon]|nr:hypothetical protein [Nitrososphaeraceae archaeon]